MISLKDFHAMLKRRNDCLRLGQQFLNEFFPEKVHPELFYEVFDEKARWIILRDYIKEYQP